jgi:hypothetical protein
VKEWIFKQVNLYFFKNHLHHIEVKVAGETNTKLFLEKIRKIYGKGNVKDAFDSQVEWVGKEHSLKYERNLITQDGIFIFLDYAVHREYLKYMSELNAPKAVEGVK